jgi:glycosyltransferase involved in cell wall biosynthesis
VRFPEIDPSLARYPVISPVPNRPARPFWSVMIPNHNCDQFLPKALSSVLGQDPGPSKMQIEVIDDRSTAGDPAKIVKRLGKGRATLHVHEVNQGIAATFNTCIERARGKWVHILHCDDWVNDGFYVAMERFIKRHQGVGSVMCRTFMVDEAGRIANLYRRPPGIQDEGVLEGADRLLKTLNFIPTPSIVVRRDVYEQVGGFTPLLAHAADWEMWMRVADAAPFAYLDEPLASYRVTENQHSVQSAISGEAMEEYLKAVALGLTRVPPKDRAQISKEAGRFLSGRALAFRNRMWRQGNRPASLKWAYRSFRFDPTARNAARVAMSVAALALGERAGPKDQAVY